jgi:hypothetical protein
MACRKCGGSPEEERRRHARRCDVDLGAWDHVRFAGDFGATLPAE